MRITAKLGESFNAVEERAKLRETENLDDLRAKLRDTEMRITAKLDKLSKAADNKTCAIDPIKEYMRGKSFNAVEELTARIIASLQVGPLGTDCMSTAELALRMALDAAKSAACKLQV
jgi:hypothetical protein